MASRLMASATAAALSRTSSRSSQGKRVWSSARSERPSKWTATTDAWSDLTVVTGRLWSPRPFYVHLLSTFESSGTLTDQDHHPGAATPLQSVLDRERGRLRRGRLRDRLFDRSVLDPKGLLKLTRLVHLGHDVATAD